MALILPLRPAPQRRGLTHALHRVGHVGGDCTAGLAQLTLHARSSRFRKGMTAPTTVLAEGSQHAASVQDTAVPILATTDRIGTMMAVVTGASVWAKNTSTRSISFGHAVHDVARIQAIRACGALGLELIVEVVAQSIARERMSRKWTQVNRFRGKGQALEQTQATVQNTTEAMLQALFPTPGRHGPAAQGEQGDADHEKMMQAA